MKFLTRRENEDLSRSPWSGNRRGIFTMGLSFAGGSFHRIGNFFLRERIETESDVIVEIGKCFQLRRSTLELPTIAKFPFEDINVKKKRFITLCSAKFYERLFKSLKNALFHV